MQINMGPEPLRQIKAAQNIFIDANVLIYGLNKTSKDCSDFLIRCAKEEIFGITSVAVLNEVCHVLMLGEAAAKKHIPHERAVKDLRSKPNVIRELTDYWMYVASIFGLNVLVLDINDQIFLGGQSSRTRFGLLTTDSVIVSVMEAYGLDQIASNDGDFDRVSSFRRYCPADI